MTRTPTMQALIVVTLVTVAVIVHVSCSTPSPPTPTPPVPSRTPTRAPSPTRMPTFSPTPCYIEYVTQPGDTCWRIAERFGTTAQAIMEDNNLPTCELWCGTRLRMRCNDSGGSPTGAQIGASGSVPAAGQPACVKDSSATLTLADLPTGFKRMPGEEQRLLRNAEMRNEALEHDIVPRSTRCYGHEGRRQIVCGMLSVVLDEVASLGYHVWLEDRSSTDREYISWADLPHMEYADTTYTVNGWTETASFEKGRARRDWVNAGIDTLWVETEVFYWDGEAPMMSAGEAATILISRACSPTSTVLVVPSTLRPSPRASMVEAAGSPARLLRVIDGDSIVVEMNGMTYEVRYIGVDTPEYGESGFHEATGRNQQLLASGPIRLEKDVSETDPYGRLLRYVFAGDVFVNAELVGLGYAQAATYPPDVRHSHYFVQLQREAREAGRGLWAE